MKKTLLPFFCLFAVCTWLAPGVAQEVDTTMWGTNGVVNAICRSGNTIYLGGKFSYVGPGTGSGVVVNGTDGTTAVTPPLLIKGSTFSTIADGKGGWYIGGNFTAVQGKARNGLAHLLPDGKLDPAFNPVLENFPSWEATKVVTLALNGSTLYVGGYFYTVNGQRQRNIAALDAATGQLSDRQPGGDPAGADGMVNTIVVAGELIYVGGNFARIGEWEKPRIAVLRAQTGEVVTSWWPENIILRDLLEVHSIAVANNVVYVGGRTRDYADMPSYTLFAMDAATGNRRDWNPQPYGGYIYALAVSGNVLYAGGSFSYMSLQPRSGMAAFDLTTGQMLEWDPQLRIQPHARVTVHALAIPGPGSRLYVVGHFDAVGQQARSNAAAFSMATGALADDWNPRLGGAVRALAIAGNAVCMGGDFSSFGGELRKNLAALDALTGLPAPWNPGADDEVTALAVKGEKLYVGGRFTLVGGERRPWVAALDRVTGAATPWRPEANGLVRTMAATGGTLLMGGDFTSIGGKPRAHLAALDPSADQFLDWNPEANGVVRTLAVSGSTMYAGGSFTSIGGQSRSYLAAIDTATRRVTAWNPEANAAVGTLAVAGNTVYAGGGFTSIGGQSRNYIAALNAATGRATAWNPGVNGVFNHNYVDPSKRIGALAVAGNTVYVAGAYTSIGGANRNGLAALQASTGWATAWNPGKDALDYYVSTLAVQDGALYAGGRFTTVGSQAIANFAAFGKIDPPPNYITGSVFEDTNGNCARDGGELAMANAVVVAQPGALFTSTDSLGNYALAVDTGRYTISQIIPEDRKNFGRQVCPVNPLSHTVQIAGAGTTVSGKNFANQVDRRPILSISVSSNRRRRCFTGITTVSYCNNGFGVAANVKVHVQLPPHVVPVSASAGYTLDEDKNLVFDVNTVAAGACGMIQLVDSVVCNDPDIRGLTQCTRAWITPANVRTPDTEWDGSDITLMARCGNNGRVRLGIYNTGTGPMSDSTAYRVYLDVQLAFTRNVKLGKGDSLILQIPANGRTVRLEADQRPGHPVKQSTNVTLEACGTNAAGKVSLGFVAQLPGDDAEPEVAEQCLPITDSFDPNDKAVSPGGVTEKHYTPTRSRLDYLIRFQNTGTDVAYKVVVADTLSADLDVSTLQLGSVSHPYQMQVSGKGRPVLTFTFNNIMLPDSNANEPESHGYIQFSIKPKADLPEKTRIENFADIFFDYNEPVRTNTTFNTLYDLPPVPAEAVRLEPDVVCTTTNLTASAGSNRTVCGQDTVVLAALRPAHGAGRWQRIGGTAQVAEPTNPTTRVSGLAYGDNVFEWRVAANSCGADSLAGRLTVTRLSRPAAPTISQWGADSLVCSATATRYDWYFEGTPLGMHTRTIGVSRPGKYSVRLTQGGDCYSEPSAAFPWLPTATGPGLAGPVRVYPNPTTGAFVVVLPPDLGGPVQLSLHDAMGRVLAVRTLRAGTRTEAGIRFDLSAGQQGVYLLKVQTTQGVLVRKVCKQ